MGVLNVSSNIIKFSNGYNIALTKNLNQNITRSTNSNIIIDNNTKSLTLKDAYLLFSKTVLWEYKEKYCKSNYIFKRGTSSELKQNNKNKVIRIYDQSLSKNDAYQNNINRCPELCKKENRINNRYYLNFTGKQILISDINLNNALTNVFIIYKISKYTLNIHTNNALFSHDNGGYDKFITYIKKKLMIAGVLTKDNERFITIDNGDVNFVDFTSLNKWVCLSVHWNSVNDDSYVYCNGRKISTFKSRISLGNNKMALGSMSSNNMDPSLNGSIGAFYLYLNKMETRDILLHHKVLCEEYNIKHDFKIFE